MRTLVLQLGEMTRAWPVAVEEGMGGKSYVWDPLGMDGKGQDRAGTILRSPICLLGWKVVLVSDKGLKTFVLKGWRVWFAESRCLWDIHMRSPWAHEDLEVRGEVWGCLEGAQAWNQPSCQKRTDSDELQTCPLDLSLPVSLGLGALPCSFSLPDPTQSSVLYISL